LSQLQVLRYVVCPFEEALLLFVCQPVVDLPIWWFVHDVHIVNVYLTLTGGSFLSVLSFFSMYCLAFSFSLSLSLSLLKKRFEKDYGAV